MGLIKSMVSSVSGTFQEQWQDLIKCDDMGNEILMKKVTTPSNQISRGSRIIVGPGQVAVIYDSGRIVDATAEAGTYEFDQSSSPSFFGGQFGQVFGEMWQRFTYNGVAAKEQAVFYFNVKEIINNKFGTSTLIPYQDWSHPIPNGFTGTFSPLRVNVRCYGKYTFVIQDPVVFMQKYAGTASIVTKELINEQIFSEVIAAFTNVINELCNSVHKVPVLELPSQTDEIKHILAEREFDADVRKRGLKIESFVIESVTPDEESQMKINEYELSSNPGMQQGKLTSAYADALRDAAKNEAGAMNGFMGIGMVNMASNGMINGAAQAPFQQSAQSFPKVDPFSQQPVAGMAAPQSTVEQTVAQQPTVEQPVMQQPVVEPVQPMVEETLGGVVAPATTQNVVEPAQTNEPAPAKFCTNCGRPVTGKFCSNCGTRVM